MRSIIAEALQYTAKLQVSRVVGIQIGTIQVVLLYGIVKTMTWQTTDIFTQL